MRTKLVLLVLVGGLTAAALLVVRQQRIQAVYDMTRALDRAAENDRKLWRLRIEIARQITPTRVRRMAENLGPLRPIPLELCLPTTAASPPGPHSEPASTIAPQPAGRRSL